MNEKRNPIAEQYPSYNVLKAVLEYEQRAAFVESVCGSATECRFGSHDRASRSVIADINPQIETPVFNDLMEENRVPFYDLSSERDGHDTKDSGLPKDGTTGHSNTTDRSSGIADLTSNRGRGSPQLPTADDADKADRNKSIKVI